MTIHSNQQVMTSQERLPEQQRVISQQIYVRSQDDTGSFEERRADRYIYSGEAANNGKYTTIFLHPNQDMLSMDEEHGSPEKQSSSPTPSSSDQHYNKEHCDNSKPSDTTSDDGTTPSDTDRSACMRILSDITSCQKVPSILIELLGSVLAIINIALNFMAYQEVSKQTTGIYYPDYAKNERVKHFDQNPHIGENPDTIHIYDETVYKNWRNFAHLGLALVIFELSGPALRLIVITNHSPKRINTLHSIVQITLLTCLVLEDGAISLCKAMLFVEECGIRDPMMSSINKLSSSISLVNSLAKTTLFVWRSSFRNQRIPRDEMEQYTEILILEEYQWFHCIIPIITHISVIGLSSWTLSQASNSKLTCAHHLQANYG